MGPVVVDGVINAGLFFAALGFMEFVAWFVHKYVMHGFLWSLHRDHHQHDPDAVFERNDWFAVFFSLPSILLIYVGLRYVDALLWIGLGIAAYGLIYFVFHDMIVHQRIKVPKLPQNGYLRRIVEAHYIHHHVTSKDGAVSFGFLYTPPVQHLKDQLKALSAKSRRPDC